MIARTIAPLARYFGGQSGIDSLLLGSVLTKASGDPTQYGWLGFVVLLWLAVKSIGLQRGIYRA